MLAVIFGVLLAIRWIGSPLATAAVNRTLAGLSDYSGHAGAVKLALWRGACDIENFTLRERGREKDPPVVEVEHASLRLAAGPLWHGKVGGQVTVEGARFAIVKHHQLGGAAEAVDKAARTAKHKQDEIRRWQDVLRDAFPLEISRLELKDGRVRFLDESQRPKVDVSLEQLHLVVTGLRNRADGDDLPARAQLDAKAPGGGTLSITVAANPLASPPRFTARLQLQKLALPPFNSFLLAYADADVSRGTFDLYIEAEARGGGYHGYVKPFFANLDFRTASDEQKNAAQLLAEKVVAAAASVLKNDEDKKVATKAPFSGNFDQNDVDLWTTIANLLRNAFVQGLREGLEGQTPNR